MQLQFALLLSLVLHAALLSPLLTRSAPPPRLLLDARLITEPPAETSAERISSTPEATPATPLPQPTALRGAALRRAQSALSRQLFYPQEAVRLGLEGEVMLLLELDAGGRVERAEIARSSGHNVLDQAALDAVRRIGSLPGNPRQTLFPVSFRLE